MVNWDDALDRRLLLTIIHVAAPAGLDYKEVAALMGPEFSTSSVQQRYTKKLKKEAEEKLGKLESDGEGGAKTPVKKTPAKKAAGEKGGAGGKRKAKKGGEEDDEELASPSKKVKTEEKGESEGEL